MPDNHKSQNVIDLTTPSPHHQEVDDRISISDDDDEDKELEMAIALSLQQDETSGSRSLSSPSKRTDLDEVMEDSDRKKAIALSLQQDSNPRISKPAISSHNMQEADTKNKAGIDGLLGLDRKAMEAERLARLKRKRENSISNARPVSPPPVRRVVNSVEGIAVTPRNISKPATNTRSHETTATADSDDPVKQTTYPEGKVFRTFASGYPDKDTITFSDLIAPATTLKSALLSSYIWDFDWLFPHFNTKSTRFLLVMHAKYPTQRQSIESDFAGIPNITLCFPPMDGMVNCMHSKLMLLFWEDRCRIVIPTANLMGVDWGVGSVMENMVWLIDLPIRNDERGEETGFERNLKQFLQAQSASEEVCRKLDKFDFGKTACFGFVHTIGGAHSDDTWRSTGHCGLGKTVSELGLGSRESIEVDFVASSVGSLNDEFMRCMYLAAQGDDGMTEYTLRTSKLSSNQRTLGTKQQPQMLSECSWRDHFRFYFPTHDTVSHSNGGPAAAGTICFSKKWWEGPKFPRRCMRECMSTRDGILMHNKVRITLRLFLLNH